MTAAMGAADAAWATALRRAHFPLERNFLDAHITLFHHLPPSALDELRERVKRAVAASAPTARIAGLMNLGRGMALKLESPELLAWREEFAVAFAGMLTPQDRASPRLHITIQNKVTPADAKALLVELEPRITLRPLRIAGLSLFHYDGGPWEPIGTWAFRG